MVSWLESKRTEDLLRFCIGIVILILFNQISSSYFTRIDLTEEQRYSIKPATKNILANLDDNIYIEVYLEGELNAGFQRLQRAVRETLAEFEIYSDHKVRYIFKNPIQALGQNARNEYMAELNAKGIIPTNVIDTRDGNRVEKIVFPGALITYGGAEKGVMLLSGSRGEEQLNSSIENVEYNLASAIYQLTSIGRKKIGFIQGQGELTGSEVLSLQNSLFEFYDINEIDIRNSESISDHDLVIIAKPIQKWEELDKYKLDQYIMNGGRAIFLLDLVDANMDSANREFNLSFPVTSGLEDMLFRYGVRVNNDLIQDNSAALYPIVVGNMGNQPQIKQFPWPYFPIFNRFGDHPISRNLDGVLGRFVNSIDTVKAPGIRKTPLIFSSDYSRRVKAPVQVSINDLRKNLKPESLNQSNIPVAYLLEGSFTSIYKNRFKPDGIEEGESKDDGLSSKLLVIADGDFVRNDIELIDGEIAELGQFKNHSGMRFSNKDFMLNAVAYMVEEDGVITARNKSISIRPLDNVKIVSEKTFWQALNLLLPLLITAILGIGLYVFRKSRYTKHPENE